MKPPFALVLLLALVAPAVARAQAAPDGPQSYVGVRILGANPELEPRSRPVTTAVAPLQLKWNDIGDKAAEPTLGIDKSGTVFYAGRGERNPAGVRGTKLFRSRDDGATWQRIDRFTPLGDSPPPDLDPWVYVDTDSGRVFEIALLVAGSYLGISDDGGDTFRDGHANSPGANDHQAFTSGPPPGDQPLLTPTDPTFPEIAYYCVNHVSDARCAASRDGGFTFAPSGASAFLNCNSALHGHAATDLEGRLYLPTGACGGLPSLSVSEDGGLTWRQSRVSNDISSDQPHTEVATDTAGNLYYVWFDQEHNLPYLATSTDQGATWSKPLMIAPPTVHEVNFPTVVAGEPGRVAITFPGTTVDDPKNQDATRPWNQYVVVSQNALDAEPVWHSAIGNPSGDPVHRGECQGRCGGLLDFLDIQLSPSDGAVWVAAVDGCTGECPTSPEAAPDDNQGGAIKQVGGPRLVGPLAAGGDTPPQLGPAPGPGTTGAPRDTRRPVLRRARIAPRAIRRPSVPRRGRIPKTRARLRFELSEAATVRVEVRRGRKRVGGFNTSATRGRNALPFSGVFGPRALRRGRHVIVLTARDAAGNRSRAVRVKLRVR